MPHFVISYSGSDSALADGIAKFLVSEGFDVWLEKGGIGRGLNLVQDIEDAISRSEFVIVLWSKEAATSRWVELQIDMARRFDKRVLPILVGQDGLPRILSDGHAIRLQDFPDLIAELKRLLSPRTLSVHTSAPRWGSWSIFKFGLMLGFVGFLLAWFWLTQ